MTCAMFKRRDELLYVNNLSQKKIFWKPIIHRLFAHFSMKDFILITYLAAGYPLPLGIKLEIVKKFD